MQQEQQPTRRVRVLGGSNKGPSTQPYPAPLKHAASSPSSSFPTSKPLKARVDPSAFTTPILRRTPSSQSTTPVLRPRAQVTPGLATHSAPATPLGSPFARAAPVTSPRIIQRPPSPIRARPGLKSSSQADRTRIITHLPSSVSTRTPYASPLPPLSVSSSSESSTPSPLTSPNFSNESYEFPSPALGAGLLPAHSIAYESPLPSPTIGQRKHSRPPITTTGTRMARSMSVTSSSSISSVVSQEEAGRGHGRTFSGLGGGASSGLGGGDARALSGLGIGKGKGRDDEDAGEVERATLTAEEERKASEERAQDARVSRKILDLEITTNSLLTINASLERLKVLQTTEIRDLRRRLRESRSLAPLSTHALADEGLESDSSTVSGDEEEEEATWEELMAEDSRFAGVAGCLEALVRRGREAIAFKATVGEGRVLHQVEMEGSWEEGEGSLHASEAWGALPD